METQLWYHKYRPISMLSTGHYGETFLAEHILLKERRVMKRIRKSSGTEHKLFNGTEHKFFNGTELLLNEANLLLKLQHPCIPRILDIESDEVYLCIILEYLEGETLYQFLQHREGITLRELLFFSCKLCSLADYLHQTAGGILHGDIHPNNLLVTDDTIKLIDFGLASSLGQSAEHMDLHAPVFCTPGFTAPEITEGGQRDERSDLYSIGCIIQYMLEHLDDTQVQGKKNRKTIIRHLKHIITDLTDPVPSKRYRYAEEAEKALLRLYQSLCGKKDSMSRVDTTTGRAATGVRTIGIIGTHPAAGVTHTSLLLASYLRVVCRKKVAVIELSGHRDLQYFREDPEDSTQSPCRVSGIDLYPDADSLLAGTLRNGAYDYVIYDLGCQIPMKEQELFRCDIKLVLTDSAVWHNGRKHAVTQLTEKIERREYWWLLLNHSLPGEPAAWKWLSMHVECMCYSPDPFRVTEPCKALFRKIAAF